MSTTAFCPSCMLKKDRLSDFSTLLGISDPQLMISKFDIVNCVTLLKMIFLTPPITVVSLVSVLLQSIVA